MPSYPIPNYLFNILSKLTNEVCLNHTYINTTEDIKKYMNTLNQSNETNTLTGNIEYQLIKTTKV